jgi:predicted metallopeptidase
MKKTTARIIAQNTALHFQEVLGLKMAIKLRLTNSKKIPALYENKVKASGKEYHNIQISLFFWPTKQGFTDSVIHELIHAWQYENGKKVAHGKSFKKWVKFYKLIG